MSLAVSIDILGESAEGRVAEKTRARLREAADVVGAPFSRVAVALDAFARNGVAPGSLAAAHLVGAGGKRVRPLSLLLACACFGDVTESAEKLATAAELVHAATLLHDDVIDDGSERRGIPTARRVFGNAVSVLAGDLLLVNALTLVGETKDGAALDELFATLRTLVDGEIVQLRGRTALDPTEATYLRIVREKTAALFVWALRSGARAGGAPSRVVDRMGEFGEHVGIAFQLVDDVIDYAGDASLTGKKLCADLLEGKLTLPLILASKADPELLALVSRLREGDTDLAAVIAAGVKRSGAMEEARARALAETALAVEALSATPPSTARALLADVANELGARVA
jgi:octaprenyl-diphosphate synthase